MALSEREQEILRRIEQDLGDVPSTSRLDGWLVAGLYVPRGAAWLAVVGGLVAMVALLPVSYLASFVVGAVPFALGAAGIIVRPSNRGRRRRLLRWIVTGPPGSSD
jgi:Flp pilus assembly protein TadB